MMRRNIIPLSVCLVAGLAGSAFAGPHVTVLPDRILTGVTPTEFLPRFASYLPKVLFVPAGATVTLPSGSTWDAIEVAGTLHCASAVSLSVTHLLILPGGTFDCDAPGVIVLRDVPIDTSRDPYQLGNGIINFGHVHLAGDWKTPKAELTADVNAGATVLPIVVPSDWTVGDEVLLPDLRQVPRSGAFRREPRQFITARTATTITISPALSFEHKAIVDLSGIVRLRPRVLNLSRTLSIASEHAVGVRGHVINIGHDATWDLQGVALVDLGRTLNVTLDNATATATGAITHVGTNQVGRYPFHNHHGQGSGSIVRDVVIRGSGVAKWCSATHQSSDSTAEDSIALDCPGAGFVTEDGPEVRNVFRRNVAVGSVGNGRNAVANFQTVANGGQNCPGCEGVGFWFHGVEQIVENNEAYNNASGFSYVQINQVRTASVPSVPGGMSDTPYDPTKAILTHEHDNVAASNRNGQEAWANPYGFTLTRPVLIGNGGAQIVQGPASGSVRLIDPYALAVGGVSTGVNSSQAYTGNLEVEGGYVGGCERAFIDGVAFDRFTLHNTTLQCRTNLQYPRLSVSNAVLLDHVTHLSFGTSPKRFVVMESALWDGQLPYPASAANPWAFTPATGTRWHVRSWQGDEQDYWLFSTQQLAGQPAWVSRSQNAGEGCPELLTWGECWSKYGVAYGREAANEAETIPLDGLLNGRARLRPTVVGPARAPVYWPNRVIPVAAGAAIQLRVLLTGTAQDADWQRVGYQLDARPPVIAVRGPGVIFGEVRPTLPASASTVGTHTVTTWRVTVSGGEIAGSRMTFTYTVE